MSEKSMAEVLAEHAEVSFDLGTPRVYTEHGGWNQSCKCGEALGDGGHPISLDERHHAHLAQALADAGFGHVASVEASDAESLRLYRAARERAEIAEALLDDVRVLDKGHRDPCCFPDGACECSVPLFDLRTALGGRATSEENEQKTISDGLGSEWDLCGTGCDLHVVRPGRVQCSQTGPACPESEDEESENIDEFNNGVGRKESFDDYTQRKSKDADAPLRFRTPVYESFDAVPSAAETLDEAAAALRQAARDGYLFLMGSDLRVPWEAVALWLDDRARITRLREQGGK